MHGEMKEQYEKVADFPDVINAVIPDWTEGQEHDFLANELI
jgi:hypothetical protein